MLVVLEGLDGAGKSTQVKKLRAYLESVCNGLEYIHFPRYDAPVYGDLISRFLRGDFGSNETVHPQLVALLFAEDRHGAAPLIRERIESGAAPQITLSMKNTIFFRVASQRSGTALMSSSKTGWRKSDWFSERITPVNWNSPKQTNAVTIPHSTCKKRFLTLMSEKWSIL